jgi:hypothetical protein
MAFGLAAGIQANHYFAWIGKTAKPSSKINGRL